MPTTRRQPPMINAPLPVTAFALLLVGLHLVRILLPESWQSAVFFQGALIPGRFWAPEESPGPAGLPGYQGPLAAFVPLIASGLLHSDWMHVILNAAFLIALAKPLLELFRRVWPGQEPGASGLLLGLFLFSQIISGLFYLGLNHPGGGAAVGASGGVSGLLAAILLIREGPRRWLLARGFLVATALFVVANALIALLGPSLLGASIAWEAHLGGYVGGAVAMRLVLLRFGAGAA